MATVAIDPGHGGSKSFPNDSSWNNAVGLNGTLEKNLTLDVGLRVKSALEGKGHVVHMTRTTDVNLRLRHRAAVAKADAFVSIHFNGSTKHNAQGTETLVHLDYSPISARLSLAVQDAVLAITGLADRNRTHDPVTRIKPQSLAVLRPHYHAARTAACLVEVSFLDIPAEEARLNTTAYRKAVANGIANGIDKYLSTLAQAKARPKAFGDAIEIEADATGTRHILTYLDLSEPQLPATAEADPNSADTRENCGKPKQPFSAAFVSGTKAETALIRDEPAWELMDEFRTFIEKLKLKHFAANEFVAMGASNASGKCKGKNTFPPKALWNNIASTAAMIDLIREELGAEIRILSCYRSPAYNTCVRGEEGSLHLKFNAIDFMCAAGTPEIWRRVADKIRKSKSRFHGGIGIYPKSGFLHIDTRGKMADWPGT